MPCLHILKTYKCLIYEPFLNEKEFFKVSSILKLTELNQLVKKYHKSSQKSSQNQYQNCPKTVPELAKTFPKILYRQRGPQVEKIYNQ